MELSSAFTRNWFHLPWGLTIFCICPWLVDARNRRRLDSSYNQPQSKPSLKDPISHWYPIISFELGTRWLQNWMPAFLPGPTSLASKRKSKFSNSSTVARNWFPGMGRSNDPATMHWSTTRKNSGFPSHPSSVVPLKRAWGAGLPNKIKSANRKPKIGKRCLNDQLLFLLLEEHEYFPQVLGPPGVGEAWSH